MATGWTPERRARQAELIRSWRPWEKSTGPRTAEGKARSRQNADRGGQRQEMRGLLRALREALAEQQQSLELQRRWRERD